MALGVARSSDAVVRTGRGCPGGRFMNGRPEPDHARFQVWDTAGPPA
jgi:hypothetical protein